MQDLKTVPKVELHCHLDGAVTPETIFDLLKQKGEEKPLSYIKQQIQVETSCRDLTEYLTKFDLTLQCIQTPEAMRRVAAEAVENAARDGVIYIEVRFAPQIMRLNGLTCGQVVENVLLGLADGQNKTGTIAHAILICMRHHTIDQNLEVVQTAREFMQKGVVAIDLAGDEAAYPLYLYKDIFLFARKYGIPCTIHAGETGDQNNIMLAIEYGASRLGHGIKAKNDPELIDFIAERGVGIEMCPTSNLQTHSVNSWEEYPVRLFYEKGVKIAVCTDDPVVSNTDLSRELGILVQHFHFNTHELKEIILNSVDMSFASQEEKERMNRVIQTQFR
jgi:adenosine deaminase